MMWSWIKNLGKSLKMSSESANFAQQAEQERKKYSNLIQQQSVMLDEYEYLVEAYDNELNKKENQQNDE
jgi:hypothetical protein